METTTYTIVVVELRIVPVSDQRDFVASISRAISSDFLPVRASLHALSCDKMR